MGKTSCKPAVVLFPAALTLAGGVGGWLSRSSISRRIARHSARISAMVGKFTGLRQAGAQLCPLLCRQFCRQAFPQNVHELRIHIHPLSEA